MKLIYVASPYAGDVEKNTAFTKAACRYVMEQGHAFFAPHLLFPQLLADAASHEWQAGLDMGYTMLTKCDELWVCGDMVSPGMQADIDVARQLGIPVRSVSEEQILGMPNPIYAIWAEAQPDGPLAGQSGFLHENRRLLFFPSQSEAEVRIKDIRSLCLNGSPAAEYRCTPYPGKYAPDRQMHLEELRELDTIPAFTPDRFEIRSQTYGNTGGGCMVGTVEFYLPEIDKSVWVSCNDECAVVSSANHIWNTDGSDSWERTEDVTLYTAFFEPKLPEDVDPWFHMISKALEYTIDREISCSGRHAFPLPVVWLPGPVWPNMDPEYLGWLLATGKKAQVVGGGRIEMDRDYMQSGQSSFDMAAPT